MSGFPGIPSLIGDTDDDASIHLNSRVGPAKPLPQMSSTSKEITERLGGDLGDPTIDYNGLYEEYCTNETLGDNNDAVGDTSGNDENGCNEMENPLSSDDEMTEDEEDEGEEDVEDSYKNTPIQGIDDQETIDEDETEVETDSDVAIQVPSKKVEDVRQTVSWINLDQFFNQNKILLVVLVFVLLLQSMILFLYFRSKTSTSGKTIDNYFEVNSKFSQIDSQLSYLNSYQSEKLEGLTSELQSVSQKQGLLEDSYIDLTKNLVSRFNSLNSRFEKIDVESVQYDHLLKEFETLKGKFENLKIISNHSQFESNLNELNAKLQKLVTLNDGIETIKEDLISKLIDILPQHLPVSFKNGRIHYVPEFKKFLFNFIDSYYKDLDISTDWEGFLKQHQASLTSYIKKIMEDSKMSTGINKQMFQKILEEKFKQNNQMIFDKFNNLVDSLSVGGANESIQLGGDKILLDNLLEIFSKGSVNTNFADYKLGSRILGFLTSVPEDPRSLPRKLILGWYDFLKASSPHKNDLKYNANNLLVDGAQDWKCVTKNGICSAGIRLSQPVVLTDLIIKSTSSVPKAVSIYVRPKAYEQSEPILQYLNEFKIGFKLPELTNKYLKKFTKVKEVQLANRPINHIKLPVSLINLRIPVRDIYLEFHADDQTMEISNIKAFGISELNSYKYNEEFDSILDNLKDLDDLNKFYEDVTILGEEEI